MMQKKRESVGAIWRYLKRNGEDYLRVKLERKALESCLRDNSDDHIDLVCWVNDKGGVEKRPDYRIFKSDFWERKDKPQAPTQIEEYRTSTAPSIPQQVDFTDDINNVLAEEDVPF